MMKNSGAFSERYLYIVSGWMLIVLGIVLMPKTIVVAHLPARGAAYYNQLIMGMWCLKCALILNGLAIIVFPFLYRHLWVSKITDSAGKPFFSSKAAPFYAYEYLLLSGVLLVALILRLIGAGQSLNGDEIILQEMFISRGLPVILTYFPYAPQHVLYSIIALLFEKLPLAIEISYRLPAILFSVGSVALTYELARRPFGNIEKWTVVVLTAVSFCSIAYSNVAKGYSLTGLLVLVFIYSISIIVRDWRKRTGWLILGLSIGALLYTHAYNAYLVIGLVFAFSLIAVRATAGNRDMFAAWMKRLFLVILLVGLVLFLFYAVQAPQVTDQFLSRHLHPEKKLCRDFFVGWFAQMTFYGKYPLMTKTCLFFAALGLIKLVRRETNLAILMIVPITILLFIAWITGSFIYPRYVVFMLPLFIMACIEGASFLGNSIGGAAGRRAMVIGFTVVFMIATASVLVKYYQIGFQDIRGAVELSAKKALNDDLIVSFGLGRDLFPFYNKKVQIVKTRAELEQLLRKAPGDVYLLYTYIHVLRNRPEDLRFVQTRFKIIKRFPGIYKEDVERDAGDVFVAVSLKDRS